MTQPLSAKRNASEEPEPVSLRFRFDSETVEQFAERYASDVSRGGIFVQSRQPFAVGTQLRLDLQLLNGTPIIVGDGTVHWTREPDAAKPNTVPGMGIRFSKLNARSQQVIEMVLSQRTGKQRTGLFSSVMPAVSLEESQKIATNSNPKSKLPFNVFPGRAHDPNKPSDDRELLANAGREETTPVVGVTAANLADARPGKDEAAAKTPPPAAPVAEMASGPSSASGSKRQPPALALIRPEAGAPNKEAEKAITESARVRRSSSSSKVAPLPAPPITTTQEIAPSSGSTPPAPVQGEPALGASQSGVPRPIDPMPSQAAAIPSVKPPMRNKLIIGAAALLAVTITVFATTRKGPVKPDAGATVAHATATTTSPAHADEAPSAAAVPSATGTAPTETAPEANGGPALEPEAPAPATSGSKPSSRVADRRAPKGKTVVAHRESQPASRSSSPAAPPEKPSVAEAPAPRVEAPVPTLAPPPPPAPVAHVEPLLVPKPVHTEPAPAPKPAPAVASSAAKPAIAATTPPPVSGGLAHKLRMTSIPSEAEVELDGKPIGRTPLFGVEIDVSQPHQLVVKKDGFAPFKQTVSRASEWNVRPSENTATLRISALMKKQ